jgi:hypothetical protein
MRVIENERKSVLFAYQKKASRFPYNFHNFTRCDVVSTWSGLVNDILLLLLLLLFLLLLLLLLLQTEIKICTAKAAFLFSVLDLTILFDFFFFDFDKPLIKKMFIQVKHG